MFNTPMAELMRHNYAITLFNAVTDVFVKSDCDIIALGWDTKGHSSNIYVLSSNEFNELTKNNPTIQALTYNEQVLFAMRNSYVRLDDYFKDSSLLDPMILVAILDCYKRYDISGENVFEFFITDDEELTYLQSSYKD